ncbi:regulatory protein SipA [Pantanalinema rosaneae CENA516]|uniref:regulatory protein SipA n=1 Tax=Pantanalinema rosaneae TaxID=1620701 RepID=UPI003D6DBBF1
MSDNFAIGDRVRLVALPPYIKTADPMPMLRSSSLIALGEEGTILDRRPGNYWSVRFTKGAYLVEPQYLAAVTAD